MDKGGVAVSEKQVTAYNLYIRYATDNEGPEWLLATVYTEHSGYSAYALAHRWGKARVGFTGLRYRISKVKATL